MNALSLLVAILPLLLGTSRLPRVQAQFQPAGQQMYIPGARVPARPFSPGFTTVLPNPGIRSGPLVPYTPVVPNNPVVPIRSGPVVPYPVVPINPAVTNPIRSGQVPNNPAVTNPNRWPFIPQPAPLAMKPGPRTVINPVLSPTPPRNPQLVAPKPRVVPQPAPASHRTPAVPTPAAQRNKAATFLSKVVPTKPATAGTTTGGSGSYTIRNVASSLFKAVRASKKQQQQQKQQQREQDRQRQQEEAGHPIYYHGEKEAREREEEQQALYPELYVQECGNTGRCYEEYCYAALADCLGAQPAGGDSSEPAAASSPAAPTDAALMVGAAPESSGAGGSITASFGTPVEGTEPLSSLDGAQWSLGTASVASGPNLNNRRLLQSDAADSKQAVALEPVGCPEGSDFTECYQTGLGDTLFTCFGPPRAPTDDDQLALAVQAACAVPAEESTPARSMGSDSAVGAAVRQGSAAAPARVTQVSCGATTTCTQTAALHCHWSVKQQGCQQRPHALQQPGRVCQVRGGRPLMLRPKVSSTGARGGADLSAHRGASALLTARCLMWHCPPARHPPQPELCAFTLHHGPAC